MKPPPTTTSRAALACDRAQAPVVVEGAEVDDLVVAERQPPRAAAGREQEPLVGVFLAALVDGTAPDEVERERSGRPRWNSTPASSVPRQIELSSLALPERLRQRRAAVRRMHLGGDEADRALDVALADASAGRVGGHAAADDEVSIGTHARLLFLGRVFRRFEIHDDTT